MRLISCHVSRTLYFSEAALYKVSIELPGANGHRDLTEKIVESDAKKKEKKKRKVELACKKDGLTKFLLIQQKHQKRGIFRLQLFMLSSGEKYLRHALNIDHCRLFL